MGGVIRLISVTTTTMMPNQIRSFRRAAEIERRREDRDGQQQHRHALEHAAQHQ
jgi:hypothetical protein